MNGIMTFKNIFKQDFKILLIYVKIEDLIWKRNK